MRKPGDHVVMVKEKGNNNNNNVKLRKGLWSPEEDEKLMSYMLRNGQGCWSDIARNAGLQRCGKSCRLRWINYLRPDLKRGAFSIQEEQLIIHLHSILGNRYLFYFFLFFKIYDNSINVIYIWMCVCEIITINHNSWKLHSLFIRKFVRRWSGKKLLCMTESNFSIKYRKSGVYIYVPN